MKKTRDIRRGWRFCKAACMLKIEAPGDITKKATSNEIAFLR